MANNDTVTDEFGDTHPLMPGVTPEQWAENDAAIKNSTGLWIEYTDSEGEDGFARWGKNVTDEQIDLILTYAQTVIGREADTA